MAVVRIDENLLKEIKKEIESGKNKYQYPSVSAFVNNAVFEKLSNSNSRKKKAHNEVS